MHLSKPVEITRKPNTVVIVSASNSRKIPECDLYIDVASFMVDDWDFRYNGTEPIIKNTIKQLHFEFIETLSNLILNMNLDTGVIVVIACEAGERRSVAAAENLADKLAKEFVNVRVYHKEMDKWLKF
jgi:RNase adaptor protein for sRNA GlmZ degradation